MRITDPSGGAYTAPGAVRLAHVKTRLRNSILFIISTTYVICKTLIMRMGFDKKPSL